MTRTLLIVAVVLLCVPAVAYLLWLVHCTLDRCCAGHARRFCRRKGLEVSRLRCQPAFEPSGVKTEFTMVQLDCLDGHNHRKLVELLVWPFGVRRVLADETYPAAYDEKWPVEMRLTSQGTE